MKQGVLFTVLLLLFSCKGNKETIKPVVENVSESIYASGIIKSLNQYQAFASASGIIAKVFASEGDTLKKGDPILSISSETQRYNRENAELAAAFADMNANQGKLNEAKQLIDLTAIKMKSDSSLYFRQKALWQKQIGSKIELEQRELVYQNSKSAYASAKIRYDDLNRQLEFAASQSKKNLSISGKLESDFTVRSEIDGLVYSLNKSKGEIVSPQTPLAVIGDPNEFILEMQVDEYDIMQIKLDMLVLVTFDAYRGQVFEAKVSKINPYMNERSKTFIVEAVFTKRPSIFYPNLTFEANIVLRSKEKAMLIPRNYLTNDSIVTKSNGDKVVVKTGLKDYRMIEILSGITEADELILPGK